jgi:pimeloyl-ACP methyl ester carboxylesterase
VGSRSKEASIKPFPPTPGELYDIGGYRLHLQHSGSGRPAAVMDSGLAGNSLLWTNTLVEVGRLTQACAFDRAGYAWSDPAPPGLPRTSLQMVEELRQLLRLAGISAPYILLGHSFGAINMLVYAYRYPHEVAGLVLVDPSHPEMFERVPQIPRPWIVVNIFRMLSGLGRLGLLRLMGPRLAKMLLPTGLQALPPKAWQALVAITSRPDDYANAAREARYGEENFAAARGEPGSLGDLQLEILSTSWWIEGKPTALKKGALPLRLEMAELSSRGLHTFVDGCDHADLPVVRADAVATAVGRVLKAWAGALPVQEDLHAPG